MTNSDFIFKNKNNFANFTLRMAETYIKGRILHPRMTKWHTQPSGVTELYAK